MRETRYIASANSRRTTSRSGCWTVLAPSMTRSTSFGTPARRRWMSAATLVSNAVGEERIVVTMRSFESFASTSLMTSVFVRVAACSVVARRSVRSALVIGQIALEEFGIAGFEVFLDGGDRRRVAAPVRHDGAVAEAE